MLLEQRKKSCTYLYLHNSWTCIAIVQVRQGRNQDLKNKIATRFDKFYDTLNSNNTP